MNFINMQLLILMLIFNHAMDNGYLSLQSIWFMAFSKTIKFSNRSEILISDFPFF